jgi:hypothetical protein
MIFFRSLLDIDRNKGNIKLERYNSTNALTEEIKMAAKKKTAKKKTAKKKVAKKKTTKKK